MTAPNDFLTEVDAAVEERSLLSHPFYQAWSRGDLTQAMLANYAAQYYQHVEAFPRYISAVHADCEDAPARRALVENLYEEEGGKENHPDLWLRFAKSLGVSAEAAREAEALPEVREAINQFLTLAKSGTVEGVAALYAYESQIPAVSETKMEGLREFYGLTSTDAHAYFKLHATMDVEHAAEERALLARLCDTPEKQARAVEAAKAGADAARRILDGVWRAHCGELHDAAC